MKQPSKNILWEWMLLEWKLERRNRTTFQGFLLYMFCIVLVAYQVFGSLSEPNTWTALFWIIMLFSSINAASRSFTNENQGKHLLIHQLIRPGTLILARMLYQMVLNMVLALQGLLLFAVFMGLPEGHWPSFVAVLIAGAAAQAALMTFIAAMAAKSGQGMGLSAILGLPLLVPSLMASAKGSVLAWDGHVWPALGHAGLLVGLCSLSLALGYVLFPYLWTD